MGRYRLDSIAQLAGQMRFMPIARRLQQLARCEGLLLQLRPDQTYTIDQITFAITDFEPKHPDTSLLAGVALQHDLGMLVEQVSESLQLHVNASVEAILTIDQVAQRLSVTSKTVQRWRRKGLPAGRYTFGDGKRRIGFRVTNLEQFVRAGGLDYVPSPAAARPARNLGWLIEQARRLAGQGYWDSLAGSRLARTSGLSPLAVTELLRQQAGDVRFAPAPEPATSRRILELADDALPIGEIARQLRLPAYGVYQVILNRRVHRAMRKPIRFFDDALYHQPDAPQTIEEMIAQETLEPQGSDEATRVPRDLPAYLRDLYRIPLLSQARERGLFLKYHYRRYLAAQAQRALDPQTSSYRQLRELDHLVREARVVRGQIVEANLRLVVGVARKHVRPTVSLMELVSEGNLTLMRAVNSFDIHRGHRFSTYAVYALMKGFARCVPAMLAVQQTSADPSRMEEVYDPTAERIAANADVREQLQKLMAKLETRERQILAGRWGLTESHQPLTFQQLGDQLQLSRQRIIQIEQRAMAKLRELATRV